MSQSQLAAPVVDWDPYDDAVLESPFEMHARLRAAGPLVFLERYGVYAMGRHRDIQPALKDWETYSSTSGSGIADIRKPGAWRPGSPIVEVDPPQHTQVRTAVQRILSPVVIRQWRGDFEREADRLVAELVERGRFDGVTDLAETYVATTFPDALGLAPSPQRRENLFLLGELNFDGQGPRNARYLATQARADLIQDWYEASMRREAMLPGGFGEKIFQAADAGAIDPAIAPLLVRSFLRGGLDTTSSSISATLAYLARDPAQFALLREDPGRARAALEEAMRLETPIQTVCRLTMRDVAIDGVAVPRDNKIVMMLASANRDPDFWERPDDYDMTRSTLGHVALGNGIHMCIGQMVARLEGESVLKAVAKHIGELRLEGEPVRKLNNNLRSLKSIPLSVKPA
ncbi:Cytochrome P450 107B1 [Bordetella hinzii]|uniref:cytochrome P450 n=1 Tax=Bordetella hinzii TaxID=103855 RepID=UPI000427446D|nr:cytochrome P450 [Bordetella hinzii]AKQ57705.1 Cytochrome P450 107B1 [Bordetella hinzii]KCB28699.1 unspecific monooxygenase domain protein [Bordetella hinzii L60]SNV56231.1 Cytochrome P450 107B1 [Bordetella hinzii]